MSETLPGTAVDIIIPVCNQYTSTRNLLEGIYRHTDLPFHIYVIDNASTDETIDLHKVFTRDITIVRNQENRGWSRSVNQAIEMGSNPLVALVKLRIAFKAVS